MRGKKFKIRLAALFLIFIGVCLSVPDQKMRLIFCDVGQGDGAIISKGSWQVLIDSGPDNGKMERCLDRYLPFWDRRIEGIIVSHWDKDHNGALARIIKSYKIDYLFESSKGEEGIEQKIYTYEMKAGEAIRYGEIYFDVVYPRDNSEVGNDSSLVVVLNYRKNKFMFSGDAEAVAEGEMMSWWREEVDGLKVTHHGSGGGSSEEWLSRLKPKVAVISVGKNNYGHPAVEVIERLQKMGSEIYRTDEKGDIILGWN